MSVGGVISRISPRTTQLTTVAGVEDNASDQTETTEPRSVLQKKSNKKYMNTDGTLHCSCKDQEIMKTYGHLEEVKRDMDKFGLEKPEVRYTFRSATNVTPPGFPNGWTPLVPANKDRTITEGEVEELEDAIDKVNINKLYNIFPVQEGNGVPQHDSCGHCRAHHSY